jgi:hypothetical protein
VQQRYRVLLAKPITNTIEVDTPLSASEQAMLAR